MTNRVEVINFAAISKDLDVIGATEVSMNNRSTIELAPGSGSEQANLIVPLAYTISASGSQNVDLSGALEDIFGDAAVFASLKALFIKHLADSEASSVSLSGNLLDDITGGTADMPLYPGDVVLYTRRAAGVSVVNSSADIITITNEDGAEDASVELVLWGVSS